MQEVRFNARGGRPAEHATVNLVLEAIADAARAATGAASARLVAGEIGGLRTVAVAAGPPGWRFGAAVAADEEGVGYAVAAGQPFSATAQDGGVPMLCVPCMYES